MSDQNVVITAFARTPFGRFGGGLRELRAPDIGAAVIDEVLARAALAPEAVDMVYGGVGMIGGATISAARQAVMLSCLPETTPSLTVDRACCSGMTSVGLAWKDIKLGSADTVLCGGFEVLSATPRFMPRTTVARPGVLEVDDPLLLRAPVVDRPISVYTGDESIRHGVTRDQQDHWAVQSHERAIAAQQRGFFDTEIFALDGVDAAGKSARIERDESPRANSNRESLARLKPVYGGLTVTAGNAPGLNDGGAMLLAMSDGAARNAGLATKATILGYAQVASGPTTGTSTPAIAIRKLLSEHCLSLDDIARFEINEAFAATPLVSTLVLADGDLSGASSLRQRTNVNGGAVAIGHPVGASGARIIMSLIVELTARGGGLGIAAICGGFGQGDAILVKVD
jgi:acetyl-CoA C-acetyltransferase